MTPFLITVAVILGPAIGSFINVVAHRIPAGVSVVRPRSRCPHCEAEIAPRDNVPVVSWFLLRGRCRHCGERISFRYPIVEATTGALFVATVLAIGEMWVVPAYWWFVGVTVALTLTDIDHKLIPNRILFPGTIAGAALLLVGSLFDGDLSRFAWGLLGGAAYFVGLLIVALLARGGFGYGDVKLAFLLGLFVGYQRSALVFVAAFVAFVGGGIISILLLVFRIRGRKDTIPFGPYLVLGAYVVLVVGDPVLDWYLG
jgi:leader peptidase (prepilin peptidase)/N-methyltransferase